MVVLSFKGDNGHKKCAYFLIPSFLLLLLCIALGTNFNKLPLHQGLKAHIHCAFVDRQRMKVCVLIFLQQHGFARKQSNQC